GVLSGRRQQCGDRSGRIRVVPRIARCHPTRRVGGSVPECGAGPEHCLRAEYRMNFVQADLASKPDVFSVDVEDWFHIMEVKGTPELGQWQAMPSRMERSLGTLLELLDAAGVKATCFFLAWVAEHFPELVRETARRGHEIGSHGYAHDVVHSLSREQFRNDI